MATTTIRTGRHHTIYGQLIPAAIFTAMAISDLTATIADLNYLTHHPNAAAAANTLQHIATSAFTLLPAILFLLHPAPHAKDPRRHIRLAALTATFLLPALATLTPAGSHLAHTPPAAAWSALTIATIATTYGTYSLLHLNTNFSLSPETRHITTTGPYRHIRHPLYLAEIITAAAIAIGSLEPTLIVGAATLTALQIVRINAEEHLLSNTDAAYPQLQAAVPHRLIPHIW